MPKITITHNAGNVPVIAGNAQRTVLLLQNNTPVNVRYRLFGAVSLAEEESTGLLLAAAPEDGMPGGSLILTGALAQKPVYALHAGAAEAVVKLDAEGDVGL
jgi:hypothetical protein